MQNCIDIKSMSFVIFDTHFSFSDVRGRFKPQTVIIKTLYVLGHFSLGVTVRIQLINTIGILLKSI